MTSADINSHDYWNDRFDEDWESNQGKEQSRFFADIASANMPQWLRSIANLESWKVCDWGCAQGDGTDVLSNYFVRECVTGVDFAESAIEKARNAYPGLRFEAQDWTSPGDVREKFNIVFSSNTLEHFAKPFDMLATLFDHAEQCVVLALPYRELNRISEHFFTFTPENIPLIANPDWVLVNSAVVDCRKMEPTYWYGEQIILVYVNRVWAGARKLVLADSSLNAGDFATPMHGVPENLAALRADNERLSNDISGIKAELQQLLHQGAQAAAQVNERDLAIQRIAQNRAPDSLDALRADSERLSMDVSTIRLQLEQFAEQGAQAAAQIAERDLEVQRLTTEREQEIELLTAERNLEVERLTVERGLEVERLTAIQRGLEHDRDSLEKALLAMKSSFFWRITGPFRTATESMKKKMKFRNDSE